MGDHLVVKHDGDAQGGVLDTVHWNRIFTNINMTVEYFSFPAAFDLDDTIRPQSLPTWLWDIVNICSGHKLIELVDVSIPTRLDEALIHLKQYEYKQTILLPVDWNLIEYYSTWASEAAGTTAMMVDIRQAHNRLLHFSENFYQIEKCRINISKFPSWVSQQGL